MLANTFAYITRYELFYYSISQTSWASLEEMLVFNCFFTWDMEGAFLNMNIWASLGQ